MKGGLFAGALLGATVASLVAIAVSWKLQIDASTFLTVVGTVVTAAAFAFGTYFAALAVDAYAQIALVRSATDKVSERAAEVERLHEKVVASEEKSRNLSLTAEQLINKIEDDSFLHLESVMQAIVSYAQKIPSTSEKQKAAVRDLTDSILLIRNTYICNASKDITKVSSALLGISQLKGEDKFSILRIVEKRFPGESSLKVLCDQIRQVENSER